jgi:hypothetical protein
MALMRAICWSGELFGATFSVSVLSGMTIGAMSGNGGASGASSAGGGRCRGRMYLFGCVLAACVMSSTCAVPEVHGSLMSVYIPAAWRAARSIRWMTLYDMVFPSNWWRFAAAVGAWMRSGLKPCRRSASCRFSRRPRVTTQKPCFLECRKHGAWWLGVNWIPRRRPTMSSVM